MNTLLETKKFSEENLEKLSTIFFLLAIESDKGNVENKRVKCLYEKSLYILEHIDRISSCYSIERISKIEDIKTRIHE
jgi:intein-encoded DNA endonuclease-like protein